MNRSWLPRSLRGRIFVLLLCASTLPVLALVLLLWFQARPLLRLWRPERLAPTLREAEAASRILLASEEQTLRRLLSPGGAWEEGSAWRLEEHAPERGQVAPSWAQLRERLGGALEEIAAGEIRVVPLPGDSLDRIVAIRREGERSWRLAVRALPAGTLRLGEKLRREATLLQRLEETLRVAKVGLLVLAVGLALLLVVASASASGLLARGVTRPMEQLTEAMQDYARAERPPSLREEGSEEVRILSRTFRRLTDQLEEARRRLAATERSQGIRDSARVLAHEIKNAATPMVTAVDLLARELASAGSPEGPPERAAGALRLLEEETRRLRRLAESLTSLGRLPEPDPRPTDPVAVLRRVVGLHLPSQVSWHLEEAPPGAPQVLVDPAALEMILVNLVRNAAEAMPDGGQLRAGLHREGGAILLWLEDTGPGLAPEVRRRLFEPGVTTKPEGSGLGLYVSRLLARASGGDLGLEESPTGGTRALLRLPAASTGGRNA
jgi:signal transduction histidine kinase